MAGDATTTTDPTAAFAVPPALAVAAGLAAAALLAAAVVYGTRRWWAGAGATADERTRSFPGDELVPGAPLVTTRAIDVAAPAPVAWAWLVQVGQDRGGFYSLTWLENLVGCRMRNADRIVPEWQHRAVGDAVALHPRTPPLRIAAIEAPRTLVLLGSTEGASAADGDAARAPASPPAIAGDDGGSGTAARAGRTRTSWAFVIDPRGPAACRLIVRTRTDWRPGLLNAALWRGIVDPGHFVMERAMLRGVARRAAATPAGDAAALRPPTDGSAKPHG